MSSCELCGAPSADIPAQVEGVNLKVCRNCAKHSSIKVPAESRGYKSYSRSNFPAPKREVPEQHLLPNFSDLLRKEREKRNLTNEDFAKLLQEKESAVAKWESGTMRPPIPAAIKMGKILGIYLIERQTNSSEKSEKIEPKRTSDELTLGDFIKVKKH